MSLTSIKSTKTLTFHRDYDVNGNDNDDLNDYDYGFQWTHFIFAYSKCCSCGLLHIQGPKTVSRKKKYFDLLHITRVSTARQSRIKTFL